MKVEDYKVVIDLSLKKYQEISTDNNSEGGPMCLLFRKHAPTVNKKAMVYKMREIET